MQESEIVTALEACGMPVAYRMFPEGHAPDLPYVCWYVASEVNFPADSENYWNIKSLTVELYTRQKDLAAERAVQSILDTLGIWDKTEEYLDDEKCYQIVYYLEV